MKVEVPMLSTTWVRLPRAFSVLKGRVIPYQEIDIEAVPGAAEQVQTWARGYKTVPTFRIGKTVVVDWSRRTVERTLREAGYRLDF